MLESFGLKPTKSKLIRAGEIFGKLTVTDVGLKGGRRYYAICTCLCGSKPKAVRFESLLSGITLSCGCLQKERATKHGLHKSPHYGRWQNMIDRCTNPKLRSYPHYGGRGIKVCEAWYDIKNFINDLPSGYSPGAELDRISNDGNYEPGNVRWATLSQNSDNRSCSRLITFNGKTQSLTRWSAETGLKDKVIWKRLSMGWTVERTLTELMMQQQEVVNKAAAVRWSGHEAKGIVRKTDRRLRIVRFNDKDMTLPELSEVTGISVKLLYKRIFERKWTVEKATKT